MKVGDCDHIIELVKYIKKMEKDVQKKSDKLLSMSVQSCTPKAMDNAGANLNWATMDLDKAKVDLCRAFDKSYLNIGTHERVYNPSPMHEYKY